MTARPRMLRAVTAAGIAGVAAALLLGTGAAQAHDGDEHETDAQHAAQDLAGVSMSTIEKDTRANAAKIKKATGVTPGRRAARPAARTQSTTEVSTDPGVSGRWSAVVDTPVVPVFQAVLPNGKVLLWDSVGDDPVTSYPSHTFTRATVWDPTTDTYHQVNVTGYNIFCAGYTQLPDGRVLVAGGNKNAKQEGLVTTHLFDWRTETWSRGPDMASGRWYPAVAALASGEALIVAGGPSTAEVYTTSGKMRRLTGFRSFSKRIYPFLVPRPDGKVEQVGPDDQMATMSTSGSGALTSTRARDGIDRSYGSFATFDIGKVLVAGGGSVSEDGQTQVPTRTASVVDVNGTGTTVRSTSSMAVGRRQFNLTILADGSVLATGGESSAVDGSIDLDHAVFAAERWDPASETWTELASASRVRQYHSVAALLPDGRVMTGGGGICSACVTKGYLEKNVEYFTPPYLFKHDGSGELAPRPKITAAPESTSYAGELELTSPQAGSIAKVGLVRLGAATHGDDQGQRYIPLSFTGSGSTLTATAPEAPEIAPPGYYMLFVTDQAGVPSVAKIIKLESFDTLQNPNHTKGDYDGDGIADLAIWRPSTGTWSVRGVITTTYGTATDVPVPGDYDGNGTTDIAVWRPSTGKWFVRGLPSPTFGQSGDQPVPADYNGDGVTDVAVWQPSTGVWDISGQSQLSWGVKGDIPVPGDYNGDGIADLAVWRPSTGKWYVRGVTTTTYGSSTDQPVAADYNGDGVTDLAVWRPATGKWYVRGLPSPTLGLPEDRPVPADYSGDESADAAVWRPATGKWHVGTRTPVTFGKKGDVPLTGR